MTDWRAVVWGAAVFLVIAAFGTAVPIVGQLGAGLVGGAVAGYLAGGGLGGGAYHGLLAGSVTGIVYTLFFALLGGVLGLAGGGPFGGLVGGVGILVLGVVITLVFALESAVAGAIGAVLAGFVVLFSRPFELGDWVVIDDQEGVVTDITIVNTQIRTFDDEYVMIPNDLVTDTDVVNRSRKGRLRLNVDVGVDYDTDLDEAIEVAEDAMRDHNLVLSPPEPHAVLTGFDDSEIGMRLRFYISNPSARKMWKARTRVTLAVKRAFDDAGIKIPFPQRELSGRPESDRRRVTEGAVPQEDAGDAGGAEAETNGAGSAADERPPGGDDA